MEEVISTLLSSCFLTLKWEEGIVNALAGRRKDAGEGKDTGDISS